MLIDNDLTNLNDFSTEDSFSFFLKSLQQYPMLSSEENLKLIEEYQKTQNLDIRNKIVSHNIRLVISIAKKYQLLGMELIDIVQYGCIGLMRSIETFDLSKGCQFSTYATSWIKQSIQRGLEYSGRTIRLPSYIHRQIQLYNQLSKKYLDENLNAKEFPDELAIKELNITEKKLIEIKKAIINAQLCSLDAPAEDDLNTPLSDILPTKENIEELIIDKDLSFQLRKMLNDIGSKEADIISLRFGLYDGTVHTLEEISQMYGITKARIGQIEKATIKKLRHPKNLSKLRQFL